MSLCFRALPGRLLSLVSGRKSLSKLYRHRLRERHVESSAFLKQFLGTQRALSVRANATSKPSTIPFVSCTLHSNLSLASLDTCSQWNKKLDRRYVDGKIRRDTMYWDQSSHRLHNRFQRSIVALSKSRKYIIPIGFSSDNVTVFQRENIVENDENNLFLDNNRMISSESLHSSWKSNIDRNILLTSDDSVLKTSPQPPPLQDNEGKPSQEQLQHIVDFLSQDLPKLFVKPQNYSIYTKDLIFINNIRGVTTRGLMNYAKQLILLKMIGHLRFAHVGFEVIKITMHSDDGTVKIRWRIRGVSGWKVFYMFWKYRFWKIRDSIDSNHEIWYDGFSTFYVNGNGKVYKHVADKVMPDQDVVTKKDDLSIASKLALFKSFANMFNNATRTLLN